MARPVEADVWHTIIIFGPPDEMAHRQAILQPAPALTSKARRKLLPLGVRQGCGGEAADIPVEHDRTSDVEALMRLGPLFIASALLQGEPLKDGHHHWRRQVQLRQRIRAPACGRFPRCL
eukprot:scaffold36942_cov50-Phaeocystis_antarctica.AAC.5